MGRDGSTRSSNYKGYGRIQEGDLTLTVAMLLRTRLQELGADVFVTRDRAEPVCGLLVSDVSPVVSEVLSRRPYIMPAAFRFPNKASERIQPCVSTDRGGSLADKESGSPRSGGKSETRL